MLARLLTNPTINMDLKNIKNDIGNLISVTDAVILLAILHNIYVVASL